MASRLLFACYPILCREGTLKQGTGAAMARHFPIFIDLGRSLPLVVGAQPGLAAKMRLLGSFASRIDLVTGRDVPQPALDLPCVTAIAGISLQDAATLFTGRSLILIDTGDHLLDERLSLQARAIGVPVNVPDKPALCSFYLGSIVDRDPVILSISTGGFAPVLAQRLRAAIEDWLPHRYGRLALYLNRIRHRIRTLPAARRRRLQHRIIDDQAASRVIEGDEARADALVMEMLTDKPAQDRGGLHVITNKGSDPAQLNRRQIEAIRNADVILHPPGEMPELVHLARREVELVSAEPAMARAQAASMMARGLEVVITGAARPPAQSAALPMAGRPT